jgi:hypothetical protein
VIPPVKKSAQNIKGITKIKYVVKLKKISDTADNIIINKNDKR